MPVLDYTDESNRRALWTWQARVGLAPKAGTVPICWYQVDHAAVSDDLEGKARRVLPGYGGEGVEVRMRGGEVQVRPALSLEGSNGAGGRRNGWITIEQTEDK